MTTPNPIVLSGGRIRREAHVFIRETGKSVETLGNGVKTATVQYVGRLRASGERFVAGTGSAATNLGGALQKEAAYWRELVLKTRDAYVGEVEARVDAVEASVSEARDAVRPDAVKVRALKAAHEFLESAQKTVDEQLAEATEVTEVSEKKPARKAPPKRKPRKVRSASRTADSGAPIRNYDQLSAKDVVARIRRLSPPQASALLDYEQGRKNRATVIRAAKQRAAAS